MYDLLNMNSIFSFFYKKDTIVPVNTSDDVKASISDDVKDNILDNEKFKKYVSTLKNLEYYSSKQINTDEEGNYIFPILPDSDIYNDKSLVKYYSSFTNNNEIKVLNYLDLDLFKIHPDRYLKHQLGIYCLVIQPEKDFVLTIIEREFKSNCENILFRDTDLYHGFIPEEDCENIKIFIDNILFEEFNNCKKKHYYQFKMPIIILLMRDKITVQVDKDNTKINFVVTFLNHCINNAKLELRNLFYTLFNDSYKILGIYVSYDKICNIKYMDDKMLMKQLLQEKNDNMVNLYSLEYLNNLKTKYIENN